MTPENNIIAETDRLILSVVRQIKRCSIRQIILGRFRFVAELSVTLKVSVSANCFLELKSPAN